MSHTHVAAPAPFEVHVSKDSFKFNAAHFVAFAGYRERLHGHNYRVSIRLQGSHKIGADGYVLDFGSIKKVTSAVCKELNEHFLCPLHSDVLDISHLHNNTIVRVDCAVDGTYFEFPRADCAMLPIVHATTEELAIYLWSVILDRLGYAYLRQRGITSLEVTVAEAPGQEATFRRVVPDHPVTLDVRSFVQTGLVVPMPCLDLDADTAPKAATEVAAPAPHVCGTSCTRLDATVLAHLTKAMKEQGLLKEDVSVDDLKAMFPLLP
jgi:6-pyruvoyltetrahydropterin/6-carboxytetrahydropterin synthase